VLIQGKEGIGIHEGIDMPGALLVVVAPTLAIYAIVSASSVGWGSSRTLGLLALTFVLGALFVVIERRIANPLIPFAIFRSHNLSGADIVRFFHGFAMSAVFFLGALYLEDVLHMSAFLTGVAYLPSNVVLGFCSLFLLTRLVRRFGPHRLLLPGFAVLTFALALLSRAPSGGSYVSAVLPSMVLVGLGASLVFMPSVTIAMSDAKPEESGLASGLTNVAIQIGSAFGVALIASISTVVSRNALRNGDSVARALTAGYHAGFTIATASAVVAGVLSYLLLVRPAAAARAHGAAASRLSPDAVELVPGVEI
jgi:predicted MFS family arabinose efflux permease